MFFSRLLIFLKLTFSNASCRNKIRVSNRLEPDQAGCFLNKIDVIMSDSCHPLSNLSQTHHKSKFVLNLYFIPFTKVCHYAVFDDA